MPQNFSEHFINELAKLEDGVKSGIHEKNGCACLNALETFTLLERQKTVRKVHNIVSFEEEACCELNIQDLSNESIIRPR